MKNSILYIVWSEKNNEIALIYALKLGNAGKIKAAIGISKNITKSNAAKELYLGVKKYLETILSEVKAQKAEIDKEIK